MCPAQVLFACEQNNFCLWRFRVCLHCLSLATFLCVRFLSKSKYSVSIISDFLVQLDCMLLCTVVLVVLGGQFVDPAGGSILPSFATRRTRTSGGTFLIIHAIILLRHFHAITTQSGVTGQAALQNCTLFASVFSLFRYCILFYTLISLIFLGVWPSKI
jgi:hypothetical protein